MAIPLGHRWSIGFGVWFGVPVRLHVLMLLFAALAVGITFDGDWTLGVLPALVLLGSVAIHEASHCIAARRLGGQVDALVLSPIGGLHAPRVPNEPEPQLFVALMGPMANLALVIATIFALVTLPIPTDQLLPLLNPVSPVGMLDGPLTTVLLKQILWINWTLFLLNLLPAYPFDGGPALRAALWPLFGKPTATVVTAYVGQGIAGALCVLAVVAKKVDPQAIMPLWAPLTVLAVFLFFSTRRDLVLAHQLEDASETLLPYPRSPEGSDLLSADWTDEDYSTVLVEKSSKEAKTERRRDQQEADEAYEDACVDDILARLHHTGFEHLSNEDRAILQRASRRYRDRQQLDD